MKHKFRESAIRKSCIALYTLFMHSSLTNQERDMLSIQKTGYHDYYDYPLTIVDCEVTIEEAAWSSG